MAETYDVYLGTAPGSLVSIAEDLYSLSFAVPGTPLTYDTTYYWRVDATNEVGTTTGDVWSFTTLEFSPPAGHATTKRLIAVARDRFWYEDV
jgi:hypothetical protein